MRFNKSRIPFRDVLLLPGVLVMTVFLVLPACKKPSRTAEVPNVISDKATHSWKAQEEAVPVNPMRNLYFGDLHVHTAMSADAYMGARSPHLTKHTNLLKAKRSKFSAGW